MNKSKFLNKLEKKLEILNEEEIRDIINEYETIIDEKIKHGKTEEEAISEFGDVSKLAKEILEAYKLNAEKVDEDDFLDSLDSTIKKGARKLSEYTKDVVDEAESKEVTIDMIFEIIIKAIVILILLMIPFSILRSILTTFTAMALPSNFFGQFIMSIISGFMSLLFLGLLILVIYLIIKDTTTSGSVKKSIKKKVESEIKEETLKNEDKIKEEIKEEVIAENKNSENNFTNILMTILKVILILHAIPLIFSLVSLYVVLAFAIYLFFKGVSVVGIILITIASIIVTSFIIKLIFKLVKTNFKPKRIGLSSLVTAFIIFLIGMFFTIDFIGSVEFINESPVDELSYTTYERNFTIDDSIGDLLTRDSNNYTVFIDDTLENDTILVEVNHIDDFVKIKSVRIVEGYISVSHTERIKLANLFNLFVDNLKDEEIYNYTKVFDYKIDVFVNQDTLDSLMLEE